jgi:hypothetical protein
MAEPKGEQNADQNSGGSDNDASRNEETTPRAASLTAPHRASGSNFYCKDRSVSFTTLIEIFVGLALIGVGYLQYTVYMRQAGIMEKQTAITIATNRAVVNFHAMGDIQGPGTDEYNFKIGNDGNATTKNLTIAVDCVWSDVKDEPFELLETSVNNAVPDLIAPKQEVQISASHPGDCRLDALRLVQIITRTKHLYFLGNVHYRDEIAPEILRTTQIAKELVINNPGDSKPTTSSVSRGRHNCADNDCPND